MRKTCIISVLLLVLMILSAQGEIFEAHHWEDVDIFLHEDPSQYRGLLFYNEDQYDDLLNQRILNVQSIFEDPFSSTFIGEPWIEGIADEVHLMRVDMRNPDLARVVADHGVRVAPNIVIFDRNNLLTNEVISPETYMNLKSTLTKPPAASKPIPVATSPSKPPSTPTLISTPQPAPVPQPQKCVCPPPPACPPAPKCPAAPACTPVPCISEGPSPSEVQKKCLSALDSAKDAAKQAQEAYENLKKEYDEYKKAVEAEKEAQEAKQQRIDDKDSVEEAKKNIDLFIHLKDSLNALEEIERENDELDRNLRAAKQQVDYRMDEWMRRYQRDYADVQDRKIKNAERQGYNEGYDEGFDQGHTEGHRKGKQEGRDETKNKFIADVKNAQAKSVKQYKDEYGLDILGEPRLVGSRLIEKGEPHDPVVSEKYDLGDPLHPIFNFTVNPINTTLFDTEIVSRPIPVPSTSTMIPSADSKPTNIPVKPTLKPTAPTSAPKPVTRPTTTRTAAGTKPVSTTKNPRLKPASASSTRIPARPNPLRK